VQPTGQTRFFGLVKVEARSLHLNLKNKSLVSPDGYQQSATKKANIIWASEAQASESKKGYERV
jgi:hypothetical protein